MSPRKTEPLWADAPQTRSAGLVVTRFEKVTLDDGHLAFGGNITRIEVRPVDPIEDVLRPFTDLATADGPSLVEFASIWGPLGLCHHRLPAAHRRPEIDPEWGVPEGACDPLWDSSGRVLEHAEDWQRIAVEVKAALVAVHDIRAGQRPPAEVWTVLDRYCPPAMKPSEAQPVTGTWPRRTYLPKEWTPPPGAEMRIGPPVLTGIMNSPRGALSHVLQRWLDLGDVRPTFFWTSDPEYDPLTGRRSPGDAKAAGRDPSTRLHRDIGLGLAARTLFGTVALVVAGAAAGGYRLMICPNCRSIFDQRNRLNAYCGKPECERVRRARDKRAERDAQASGQDEAL